MAAEGSSKYAYRVVFEYEGDQIRKVSQQRIEMSAPPSHSIEGHQNEVGFWYELRDANDKPVYRRVIQNPIQSTAEVFSPDGSIVRRPVEKPRGVFHIVVPEISEAATLVLVGTPQPAPVPAGPPADEKSRPPIPRVGTQAAREIARFSLKEDTK
jgi:hypothetical protein